MNTETESVETVLTNTARSIVKPWIKAGMELPRTSVVELSRISGVPETVVLDAVDKGKVVLNGTIPAQEAVIAGTLDAKQIKIPRRGDTWSRAAAAVWSEGQRYQRRFQFSDANASGKPTSKKIRDRVREVQVARTKIAFQPVDQKEKTTVPVAEKPVKEKRAEDPTYTMLVDDGRYRPIGLERVRALVTRGVAGERIVMPTLACYNHEYEGLGIAMDVRPYVGRDNDPDDQRRDAARIETYRTNLDFLRSSMPNLEPIVILPDVDLQVLGRICRMPEGIMDRAATYREDLAARLVGTDISVLPLSELLDRYGLRPVFEQVLRSTQENLMDTIHGKIGRDKAFVNKKAIDQQTKFDVNYYNTRRNAKATPAEMRRRVVMNYSLYAAQKEVLLRIYGDDLLFFSVESPMEDRRYAARDKKLALPGMPIIYPILYDQNGLELDFSEQTS